MSAYSPASAMSLNLISASLSDVSRALDNGTLTSVQLVEAYLGRPILTASASSAIVQADATADAIDSDNLAPGGKQLRAVSSQIDRDLGVSSHLGSNWRQGILADARALAIARELDDERQCGVLRSSLHGVPIGVKSV